MTERNSGIVLSQFPDRIITMGTRFRTSHGGAIWRIVEVCQIGSYRYWISARSESSNRFKTFDDDQIRTIVEDGEAS